MKNNTKRAPVSILISDVHYNIQTLELADKAMRQALDKANELNVPLIIAGDLHDTKANMRAECVNAMISTFGNNRESADPVIVYLIIGNHDRINEKATAHSLHFLAPFVTIVDTISIFEKPDVTMVPYHHSPDVLRASLKTIPEGSTLIMHQGVQGSNAGDYIQDHSALNKEDVAPFRVISGHYHQHQTIQTRPLARCIGGSFNAIAAEYALHEKKIGLFTYIGNPYTLNFGEANDPPKGFGILYDNGDFDLVPTRLRKHHVVEVLTVPEVENKGSKIELLYVKPNCNPGDLVWVKLSGPSHLISKIERKALQDTMGLPDNFRLDLIPTDRQTTAVTAVNNMNQHEILDSIIQANEVLSDKTKEALKQLWRSLTEEN